MLTEQSPSDQPPAAVAHPSLAASAWQAEPLAPEAMDIVQEGYRQQEKFKEPEESAQTMGRQAQAWMQLYPEQFQASEASYYLAQICRASGANGFALDEISWQQIEQEKSIAILRAILAIAAIPSRDSNFWHWRRYILEDAQLWPYLVATPAAL